MSTIQLAAHDTCTGCGACAFKCPKHCIEMRENEIGMVLPVIETSECIECHSCEKVCPILNMVDSYKPTIAYAAWSNDEEERLTSASGGIAIEMYKHAVGNGFAVVGASQNEDFTVTHKITTKLGELKQFKNSKYVFSNAYEAFPKIKALLHDGKKVIFIGLPCQVAALRNLFRGNENLLLVEVVCHGTTPFSYLRQHIDILSKRSSRKASRMSFRDPEAYTYTYTFTLYDENGECFYSKRTKDGDTYQFGYHRGVTYRENCYHCRFAKPERNADVTIADYHGLGLCAPCKYDDKNVSLILINTDKGDTFIRQLIDDKRIHAEQRPLEEPFKGEAQLRHPSVKNKYRMMFEKRIASCNGDFEKAIRYPQRRYDIDMRLRHIANLPREILRKLKTSL